MKQPTTKQREIMDRVASCGWDVVHGAEVRSAECSPYLHVEVDWEAGDPEHGEVVKVARLTDEGAAWYKKVTGAQLQREEDGSWDPVHPEDRTYEPPGWATNLRLEDGRDTHGPWVYERCKSTKCRGRRVNVGFLVSDEDWLAITGQDGSILCLTCFDEMAQTKGIRYEILEVHPIRWHEEEED